MVRLPNWIYLVLISLCFATASPLTKFCEGHISIAEITTLRLLTATIILSIYYREQIFVELTSIKKSDLRVIVLCGLLFAIHLLLFGYSLVFLSFTIAVILLSIEPIAINSIGILFFNETPTKKQLIGTLFGILGAVVVCVYDITSGSYRSFGFGHVWHDAIPFLSLLSYGIYFYLIKHIRVKTDSGVLHSWSISWLVFCTAALACICYSLCTKSYSTNTYTMESVFAAILLGLIPTALGHGLLHATSKYLPTRILAFASPGETLGSIVLGILLLGTSITIVQIVGALFIALGGYLVCLQQKTNPN